MAKRRDAEISTPGSVCVNLLDETSCLGHLFQMCKNGVVAEKTHRIGNLNGGYIQFLSRPPVDKEMTQNTTR